MYIIFWFIFGAFTSGIFGDPPKRITNGLVAFENEFPYQVSLRLPENEFLCGGAIISSQHILTAAHCLQDRNFHDIYVVTGANNLNYGGVSHTIKRAVKHDKFIGYPWDLALFNDIAILTLTEPLKTNDYSWRSIKLATRDYTSGWSAVVAGWGQATEYNKYHVKDLRKIKTSLADLSECQAYTPVQFDDTQICILATNGKSTCPGDSGGPIVVNGEVVGIASTYLNCGKSPTFFTKVYAFRDFIRREMTKY